MSFVKQFSVALLTSLAVSAAVVALSGVARAAALLATPADLDVVHALAKNLSACVDQPIGTNAVTGNSAQGPLRSHCDSVSIIGDRVEMVLDGMPYTLLVRESALSDGGDLTDLFIQYGSREDQEVLVAGNVLAFSDPALAVLLVGGYRSEDLPRVRE